MGTFFILVIALLTLPALIGLIFETKFWYDQVKLIKALGKELHSTDPPDMSDWLSKKLGDTHPLIRAIQRILATDHAPESSVDLIEPNNGYVRFLIGWRRYAITVVLLCGIAGTLFSLHAAIPLDGNFAPHQLQAALANAFWPSIWGVISTLLLQFMRFAFLDPIQHKAELDFVALASNRLIPWSIKRNSAAKAVTEATSKLQAVVDAFTNAANAGVAAIKTGSDNAKQSFEQFDATVDNACENLSSTFEKSATHISTVGTASVSTIKTSVQSTEQTITAFGTALAPIIQRMEGVTMNLKQAADRFDQSVAANGPFLTAMEQLYKASNPAEERYEKLLVAIMEMQKLSTIQNTILLQLHQETAKLTLSTIRTADESVQLAQTIQAATTALPATLLAVTKNNNLLETITKQWQSDVNRLTAALQTFLANLQNTLHTQRQLDVNGLTTILQTFLTNLQTALNTQHQVDVKGFTTVFQTFLINLQSALNTQHQVDVKGFTTVFQTFLTNLQTALDTQHQSDVNTLTTAFQTFLANLQSALNTQHQSDVRGFTAVFQTFLANLQTALNTQHQLDVKGFTAVFQTFLTNLQSALNTQRQSDVKDLTSEFQTFLAALAAVLESQEQLTNDILGKLSPIIVDALTTKLLPKLSSLADNAITLNDSISKLQITIEKLHVDIQSNSI